MAKRMLIPALAAVAALALSPAVALAQATYDEFADAVTDPATAAGDVIALKSVTMVRIIDLFDDVQPAPADWSIMDTLNAAAGDLETLKQAVIGNTALMAAIALLDPFFDTDLIVAVHVGDGGVVSIYFVPPDDE